MRSKRFTSIVLQYDLLLETAKDNLAYTQNTFIMALGTRNDRA